MSHDSLTQFKSQGLIFLVFLCSSKISIVFCCILNNFVPVIMWFQWLIFGKVNHINHVGCHHLFIISILRWKLPGAWQPSPPLCETKWTIIVGKWRTNGEWVDISYQGTLFNCEDFVCKHVLFCNYWSWNWHIYIYIYYFYYWYSALGPVWAETIYIYIYMYVQGAAVCTPTFLKVND